MSNKPFIITTDTASDLPMSYYQENNLPYCQLSFVIDGEAYQNFDSRMNSSQFYDAVRGGAMPVTQQVNPDQAMNMFEPLLQEGNDILHIGFSSGLSGSYNSSVIAADELREKYPEATIITIDSLSASLGQGLLVHKALAMKNDGATMQEIADWVEENKLNVVHLVIADDLNHLHRGGRVSKASAVVGTALGIKPMIHVNDLGRLIAIEKVRGRKASLIKLADKMADKIQGCDNVDAFISHADCLEEAEFVAEQVKLKTGCTCTMIDYIGPVIGSHTGPGTVGLFFIGNKR